MLVTIELDYFEEFEQDLDEVADYFDKPPENLEEAKVIIQKRLSDTFWDWFDTYNFKYDTQVELRVHLDQEELDRAFNIEPDPHDQWASVVRYYREKSKA